MYKAWKTELYPDGSKTQVQSLKLVYRVDGDWEESEVSCYPQVKVTVTQGNYIEQT